MLLMNLMVRSALFQKCRENEKKGIYRCQFFTFSSAKGLEYFIDAAKVNAKNCNIAFIVGDGPLHDEIVEQVHRLQMEEHIHFWDLEMILKCNCAKRCVGTDFCL